MRIAILTKPHILKEHLSCFTSSEFSSFIALGPNKEKITRNLLELGFQPLQPPAMSPESRDNFLNNYIKLVSDLGAANINNHYWWATDLASRNRVASPLLQLITDLEICIRSLDILRQKEYVLIAGVDWPLALILKQHLKEQNVSVKIIAKPSDRLVQRIKGKFSVWKKYLKESLRCILNIYKTHKIYKKPIQDDGRPVYLIRSFVYDSAFTDEGYKDPFFGEVRNHVADQLGQKIRVLTVALGFSDRLNCYAQINDRHEDIVPLEVFLSPLLASREIIGSVWKLLFCKWNVPQNLKFMDIPVSAGLNELLASGGWHIQPMQMLHRAAGEKIARILSIQTLLLTCEGNPWESMLIQGMRRKINKLEVIGYQHSVVPLAATGMFKTNWELENQPLPDRILTTGVETAKIIQKYSCMPDHKIQAACAVRYNYLFQMQALTACEITKNIQILVALEGLIEVTSLVEYTLTQAQKLPYVSFVIRPHPVLSLKEILGLLGRHLEDLPSNVSLSKNAHVLDDVRDCHAVLYWGTTVSVEAISLGRPVIHFDRQDPLSYDPLFNLSNLHWTVSPDIDLSSIVDMIANMNNPKFEQEYQMAQNYVTGYFNKLEKQNLDKFLPLDNRYS